MHPRRYDYSRPLRNLILGALQVCDNKHVDRIASNGPTHLRSLQAVLRRCRVAGLVEELDEVGVGVWVAVGEVYLVVVECQRELEAQGIISRFIPRNLLDLLRRLVVSNVEATSVPAVPRRLLVLLRVDEGLHPLVVGAFWLEQVNDVESVLYVLPCVRYFEVEPLSHERVIRSEISSQL